MRAKSGKLFVRVGLVIAFVVAIIFWMSSGPSYKGKSYRAWLDQYISSVGGSKAQEEAKAAILHIGPDAIPTLLSMIGARDTPFKKFIAARLDNRWVGRTGIRGALWRYSHRSSSDPLKASVGFPLLGPSASNAVPGLGRILRTSNNPQGVDIAIQCLAFIGPPARTALPELVEQLDKPTSLQMYESMRSTRVEAIYAIACENGKWHPDSLRILLPALTNALKGTNESTFRVLMMLEKMGPDAKSTVPAVQPFLASTNSSISMGASRALKSIDPDGKVRSGTR